MDPTNQMPQMPNLQVPPQPAAQPKMNLILIGVIVLLLVLLGGSFYQVLSLKKQVDKLETAAKSEPTPVATPVSTTTGTVSPAPTGGTNEPIEITGIIKFSNLESGCWSIVPQQSSCTGDRCPLSDLPNYEIINIPTALKKDGIKASFKLEMQTGVSTTCQLGPAVKILDYQILR